MRRVAVQILFSLTILLPGCAFGDNVGDLARIVKKGELVVSLLSEDTVPFVYQDGKELKGLDVDLARLMARKLGVQIRFLRTAKTFDEVVQMIANGKADLGASALYPTLERAKTVIFSDCYWDLAPIIAVNRVEMTKRSKKQDLAQLLNSPGVKVGLYDTASFLLADHPKFTTASIVKYKDRMSYLTDLKEGKLAVGYFDGLEAAKWQKIAPDINLYVKFIKDDRKALPVAFAVNWEDDHFAYWVNLFIKLMKNNGTLERIAQPYLKDLQ